MNELILQPGFDVTYQEKRYRIESPIGLDL